MVTVTQQIAQVDSKVRIESARLQNLGDRIKKLAIGGFSREESAEKNRLRDRMDIVRREIRELGRAKDRIRKGYTFAQAYEIAQLKTLASAERKQAKRIAETLAKREAKKLGGVALHQYGQFTRMGHSPTESMRLTNWSMQYKMSPSKATATRILRGERVVGRPPIVAKPKELFIEKRVIETIKRKGREIPITKTVIIDKRGLIVREATGEERELIRGVEQRVRVPEKLKKADIIRLEKKATELRQKRLRGKADIKGELELAGLTMAGAIIGAGLAITQLPQLPGAVVLSVKKYVRDPASLREIPEAIARGGAEFGQLLRISPTEALVKVGAEILIMKGLGKALKVTGALTSKVATKLTSKFKGVAKRAISIPSLQKGKTLTIKVSSEYGVGSMPEQLKFAGERTTAVSAQADRLVKFLKTRKIIRKPIPGEEKLTKATKKLLKKFDKGTITPKELIDLDTMVKIEAKKGLLERSFFADPEGVVRKPFLRLGAEKEASLLDILAGDVTFKTTKPQILIFEKVKVQAFPKTKIFNSIKKKLKIGKTLTPKESGALVKFQLKKTGKFKPIGFQTSEMEITLAPGEIVKKVKTVTSKVFKETIEEIPKKTSSLLKKSGAEKLTSSELKKLGKLIRSSKDTNKLLKKASERKLTSSELERLKKATIKDVSLVEKRVPIVRAKVVKAKPATKKLLKKADKGTLTASELKRLRKNLKKETGFSSSISDSMISSPRLPLGRKAIAIAVRPKSKRRPPKKPPKRVPKRIPKKVPKRKPPKKPVREVSRRPPIKKLVKLPRILPRKKIPKKIPRKIVRVPKRKIPKRVPKRKPPIRRPPKKVPKRKIPKRIPKRRPPKKPPEEIIERIVEDRIEKPPVRRLVTPPRKKKVIKPKKKPKRPQAYEVWARPLKKKGQKKPKLIKVSKVPLSKTKAKDLRNLITDQSLGRTARIKPIMGKPTAPKLKVPKSYSRKTSRKFRRYKVVKGKRIPLQKGRVIERGKFLLDTIQEKKQITLKRRIAQLSKPPKKKPTRSRMMKHQTPQTKKFKREVIKKAPKGKKPTRYRFKGSRRLGFRNNKVVEIVKFKKRPSPKRKSTKRKRPVRRDRGIFG